MTYININAVNFDDVRFKSKLEWLQEQEDGFVLLSEGDNSAHYDFDLVVLTLEEVLEDVSENEDIVFADDDEVPNLQGFTKGKSYWGDPMLTKDLNP